MALEDYPIGKKLKGTELDGYKMEFDGEIRKQNLDQQRREDLEHTIADIDKIGPAKAGESSKDIGQSFESEVGDGIIKKMKILPG